MGLTSLILPSFFTTMEIKLTIDQNCVDNYNAEYFKAHPRAKKPPIKAPQHPTLNWYMTANNMSANNVKQHWKNLIFNIANEMSFADMGIEKCEIQYKTYFKTNRLMDLDNITPKFILDGLVHANVLVADDYKHITKLTTEADVDKSNPRIEMVIVF
ncbi:hypothetical protein M2140_000151 [Clostridiales Family XIII bacterium PM5-7]